MSKYSVEYYQKNKARIQAANRAYSKANDGALAKRRRERYANDPEYRRQRIESAAAYRQKYPDKIREKVHGYKRTPVGKERQRRYMDNWNAKKYGLTISERDKMFAANNGLCYICSKRPSEHVDHDHGTGRIRGALCNHCNRMLGASFDDPEVLLAGADYLRRELCITG